MKKLPFILVLIIIIVPVMTACGRTAEPECGLYTCEQLISGEEKIRVDSVYSEAPTLELLPGGKGVLTLGSKTYDISWKHEKGAFSLEFGQITSEGKLENGVCRLDLMGTGLIFCFFSKDSPLPQWTTGETASSESDNRWSGDWYGYWRITNAKGEWECMDEQSFDMFAHIDMDIAGSGTMLLWDESGKRDEPIATVELSVSGAAEGKYGTARSVKGSFYSQELGKSRWVIRPDIQFVSNLLCITDHYYAENGSFDYQIILRPWGYVWDDVIPNGEIPLPYYYFKWYLPALSTNEPMPDEVEFESVAVIPGVIYRGDVE